ncbi:MAG: insulinase family protein, partial [Bdellovibrionales bacterium]|nr:insulinase family protein [Bdellovibrionales bacterium]
MFKKYQLKNGMTVILVESHKSPVVSVQMWVKTGSADEKKGEEGLSHFIEHLVFKGSDKYGVGEIAQTVEGAGGELNAYTSFDQTVFYVTISKAFTEVALDVISQMMGSPRFDSDEIDNEREVVLEEIKRSFDSPGRVSSQNLFSTLYKDHPYSIPILGYEKNIRNVTQTEILDYYHRRYVPENMTLVVAGNFDPGEIKGQIKNYFENFKSYKLKKIVRKKDKKQDKPRLKIKNTEFKDNLLYISWPIPKIDHKDILPLDIFSLVMGYGESSRLTKTIKNTKHLVNYVSCSTFTPLDPGFMSISASLQLDKLEDYLDSLLEELEKVLKETVDPEEIKKAIINLEADEYYSLETVDGLARKVGTYHHLFSDYKYFQKLLKEAKNITPLDILKTVRKYMKPEMLNFSMTTPGEEKEIKKTLRSWSKKYEKMFLNSKPKSYTQFSQKAQKVKIKIAEKPKQAKATPQKIVLNNGVSVISLPSFETPVVNMRCVFMGGLRAEKDTNHGSTELLARTWSNGTKNISEAELFLKTDNLASSLFSFGGRNTIGLNMSTLSFFADEMRELFFDVLLNPRFSDGIIEREKILMIEHLKKREDNPAQLTILDFMKTLYGKHPYAQDLYSTEANLKKVNSEVIREHLQNMSFSKNLSFVVVGFHDTDRWVKSIEKFTKDLPVGNKLNSKFDFVLPESGRKNFFLSKKEQSHIVVGYPGLTFTSKERYALEVMQSVLSGQGGRLFIELRDKASLAYSVAPIKMEGIDAGHFGAYIGCSPEKGKTAIRMMKEQFDRLMNETIPEVELERSKKYLIGGHDIGLQKNSAVASSMLFDDVYGLDFMEPFKYAEYIQSITADEVKELARKIFSGPEIVSCVGSV